MNRDQCLGSAWIVLGHFEEWLGSVVFSERCRRRGFEHRVAGESRRAIGEASKVIAHCRRSALRDGERTRRSVGMSTSGPEGASLHNATLIPLPWLGRS